MRSFGGGNRNTNEIINLDGQHLRVEFLLALIEVNFPVRSQLHLIESYFDLQQVGSTCNQSAKMIRTSNIQSDSVAKMQHRIHMIVKTIILKYFCMIIFINQNEYLFPRKKKERSRKKYWAEYAILSAP